MAARRIAGLYAITPEQLDASDLVARCQRALAGGARLLQYRDKRAADANRLQRAAALAELCRAHAALFIVNDDVELAAQVRADGVHLGRDDVPVDRARAALGRGAIIGVSCYADLERAGRAAAAGADYLAFGSCFASPVKPEAPRAPLALLRQARRFGLPVVAIGGITRENAAQAIGAGADAIAVITAVFGAADVERAARALARLFDAQPREILRPQP